MRGDYATPGQFRRSQNWIGHAGCTLNEASFVPPPPDALLEHLSAWEAFLHDRKLPPLIHLALAHYQFEDAGLGLLHAGDVAFQDGIWHAERP